MKKLFASAIAVLLVITFASVVLADATPPPADVQQALDRALSDPPINSDFLWDVGHDTKVRALMKFAPIVVKLDRLTIYFSIETDPQLVLEKSCGTMLTVEPETGRVKLGCEDGESRSCCTEMTMIMMEYHQSDFWAALTSAIQTGAKKK